MKPFRQGGLDLHCGVYAVINAFKLLLENQIADDDDYYLEIAVYFISELAKERGLSFISDGLNSRDLTFLLKVALSEYGIKWRKAFKFSNVSLGVYWNAVENFFNERKSAGVIILCLDPDNWAHWTVITQVTERRLILLDSIGIKVLNRRQCTTRKITSRRDMLLSPTRTYFLYV